MRNGKGFLENIIALYIQDATVYRFIPDMLGDENMRVRLGATALVEELVDEYWNGLQITVSGLIILLRHESLTIRGDAASALGIIKDPSAVDVLQACLRDTLRAFVRPLEMRCRNETSQGTGLRPMQTKALN